MERNFYLNLDARVLRTDEVQELEWAKNKVLFTNSWEVPTWENIMLFEWIFSQNFWKGEKSRNGYKYDQNGWYVDNYARYPIILWQHDDNYWWIGYCKELWLDTNSNLCGLFYVDLDTLEERNAKQVRKWMIKGISTGASKMEAMFELNETGKRYTQEEAIQKFWREAVVNCLWGLWDTTLTYIITKAELIENSLVTIWSNYWALARQVNGLEDDMKNEAEKILKEAPKKVQNLYSNIWKMKEMKEKKETQKNDVETSTSEVTNTEDSLEASAKVNSEEDVKTSEWVETAEKNSAEGKNTLEVLTEKLETLQKNFDEFKENSTAEIDKLKAENKTLRDAQRKDVLESAPNVVSNNNMEPKSASEIKKSYTKR